MIATRSEAWGNSLSRPLLPSVNRVRKGTRGSPSRNQNGQTLGAKGSRTRRFLMEATAKLLATRPLRELRVTDIARTAKASAATFYVYFEGVDHAVLAVIEELSQSTPKLLQMLAEPWPEAEYFSRAVNFTKTYMHYWRSHKSVFHARNLAADEGDARFVDVRNTSVRPLLEALADRIAATQAKQEFPQEINAVSTAGELIAMLERLAAVDDIQNADLGITPDGLIVSAAYVLATAMHGNGALVSAQIVAATAAGKYANQVQRNRES
jgi:AcrR family transcriptional regulator